MLMPIPRRSLLKAMAAAPAASLIPARAPGGIVDTHVYVGRWPFRRMPGEEMPELTAQLRAHGVTRACAGSFEGVFHKDLAAANERLARQCADAPPGFYVPFGAVNVQFPDWEEDLRRCHEQYRMPGIRVHPGYHNYTLADPAFARLLRLAAERGLVVQLVCWLEDERHHNPRMPVPTVALEPLPGLIEPIPNLRLVLQNGFQTVGRAEAVLKRLKGRPNVYYDFGMLDALLELRLLIDTVGLDAVVLGSYSPMFYFESVELKMQESALDDAERVAVSRTNATRLLRV